MNENGATLHYQYKEFTAPDEHRSLLIDAGAEVDGYACDITRTWGNGDDAFADLVTAVDREQQGLAGKVRAGTDYRDLHLECHLRLGSVLRALEIVDMDPGSMLETGSHSAEWDGRDDHGARVGTGLYFCRLDVGSATQTRRIVFAR